MSSQKAVRDEGRFSSSTTTASAPQSNVEWLARSQDPEWDRFVSEHPYGTVCQTTRWRSAVETAFPHVRGATVVLREAAGGIRAGTTVYTVRSRLLGTRLVSIPFASRTDPLVTSVEDFDPLLDALEERRRDAAARSFQIRMSQAPLPAPRPHLYPRHALRGHYLPLHWGIDAVWNNLDPSLRRRIKKAAGQGVSVRRGRTAADVDVFFKFYGRTRQRLRLPALPKLFFYAIAQHLQEDEWSLFIAEESGEPVAVDWLLTFNGVQQLEWMGEGAGARACNANHKMFWTCVEDAAERGRHTVSFGVTDVTNTGLLEYKRSWGTIERDMPVLRSGAGSGVPERRADNGITRTVAQRMIQDMPWPLYVRFSEACYRHLG